jgi:hypothetical protein
MDRLKQYHTDKFNSELISNVEMLSEKDREIVKTALNKTWTNPKFKMKWFVGEIQITPFAKMRQWLLEIGAKEELIDFMEYELKKLEIKIKRLKRLLIDTSQLTEFEKEENELELLKAEFDLKLNQRRLNDSYLERQQLIDILNEFLDSDEGKTEDGRPLMEVLNTDEEDQLEVQYWTIRLAKQAAMDIISYGRIGVGNMDALCSLSQEQQTEALALAHRYALEINHQQYAIKNEMALQLGLTSEQVFAIEGGQMQEIKTKHVKEEAASNNKDSGDLESVYRI